MSERLEVLERRLETVRRVPGVPEALAEWEAQSIRVTWACLVRDGLAAIQIQTPDRLQRRFGLAPELLFLFSGGHLQARHTRDGVPAFARSDRTDPGLAFWSDPHDDLGDRLGRLPLPAGLWLPWQPGGDSLDQRLARALRTHDPFDVTQPVRGRARIGRDGLLATVVRELDHHGAVGLYGLRKVGKTSVALGLDDLFRDDPNRRFAYADAQTYLGDGRYAAEGLLGRLLTELGSSGEPTLRSLRQCLETQSKSQRTIVVIDEFDWLLSEPEYDPFVLRLLAMIRGLAQTHPGRAQWVLVGREPARLDGPRIAGRPNPTLNFWRGVWVGPLNERDLGTMLRRLGKRMGLELGHRSKQRAFELTNGHPHLARVFGRVLAQQALAQGPAPMDTNQPTDPFVEAATDRFLRERDTKNWVEEVGDLLREHYPDAAALLHRLIADEGPRARQTLTVAEPEAAELLTRFGLIDAAGRVPDVLRHHHRRLGVLDAA